MKNQIPPLPYWGDDELTKFLDAARENQFAVFTKKIPETKRIIEIDSIFCRVIDGWRTSRPELSAPYLLFYRAHCSYRATAGCALAGHAPELYPLLRSMLEQGGYAFLMNGDSELTALWLHRDANPSKVIGEFKVANIKKKLASLDPGLKDYFHELYEKTIEFGAHPNEMSVTGSLRFEEEYLHMTYLHPDGIALNNSLRDLVKVGTCVLLIFQGIFLEQFELLGIPSELTNLKKDL